MAPSGTTGPHPDSDLGAVTEHLLVRATESTLTLTATDLNVVVSCSLPATVALAGTLLLHGRHLAELVSRGRGTASVSLLDQHLTLGDGSFTLPTLDPVQFPSIPERPEVAEGIFSRSEVTRMVRAVSYALSRDETRPHLCAALLERREGSLWLVATDGHRLAAATTPDEGAPFKVLVHRRGIEELERLLTSPGPEVVFHRAQGWCWFTSGSTVLTAKVIEATFPTWQEVVPEQSDGGLTFRRKELLAALAVVAPTRGSGGVTLCPTQSRTAVELTTTDGEGAEARVTVTAYVSGEVPRRLGLDVRYLRELLDSLTEDDFGVTLEVSGDLDPVKVVGAKGTVAVVMPMRL